MKHPFNHVRMYRKRHALSTAELAFLMGGTCRTAVSRLEAGRPPSLKSALALQVIFGAPPAVLFAGLSEQVHGAVRRRAQALRVRLAGRTDSRAEAKRELLDVIVSRDDDATA